MPSPRKVFSASKTKMSLLISRDYANASKPLWLPTSGGTIDGSLNVNGLLAVTGNISATGDINAVGEVTAQDSLRVLDSNAATKFSFANDGAGNSLIQSTDTIKFTQLGTANGNTTFVLSAAGANADNFSVGGTMNCLIGPVPTQLITSTKTVNPVAVPPAAPSQFGVDLSLSSISNAEYDVQATGTVYVVSGAVDASDTVLYQFTAGSGGTMNAIVYPGQFNVGGNYVSGSGPLTSGGAAATVQMRSRVTPSVSGTVLGANVKAFPAGGSTAVYGATLTLLDVQRVR